MFALETQRRILFFVALAGTGLALPGCQTLTDGMNSVTSFANGMLGKDDKQSVQVGFGELKGSQQEAKTEVEDTYAALEGLADAPAAEIDVYYAQYTEASRELRSKTASYGVAIDDAEKAAGLLGGNQREDRG